MSKKEQFNDGEIEDLFSKVEIPLEKDKNHIWSEKFESLVKEDVALSSKKLLFFVYIGIMGLQPLLPYSWPLPSISIPKILFHNKLS